MKRKVKVCDCPNCQRAVDITDEDMIDDIICMVCKEFFDPRDIDKKRIREIEVL